MDIGRIFSAILIFFLGIIEVLLGFRFVFMLLAANSTAEFTSTIYATTDPLVAPFNGVFPSFQVAQFSLDLAAALAMIVYGVVGFVLMQLARRMEGMKVKPSAPAPMPQSAAPVAPTPQMPVQPMMQTPQQPAQPYVPQTPQQQIPQAPNAQNMPASMNQQSGMEQPAAPQNFMDPNQHQS